MKKLKAIHVNWTRPSCCIKGATDYKMSDFELLCLILSSLLWRKHNGTIKLYTDNVGYEYYKKLNLLSLWNGGIDVNTLESISEDVSPSIYWAAAKIFALQVESLPVVLLDTDLLVWENLERELEDVQLAAFHRESIATDCYLSMSELKKRSDYQFDSLWNWKEEPCNTALAYFNNEDFRKYYTSSAINFMQGNDEHPSDRVSQMVFAEQRLFSMCAKKMGVPIHTFLAEPYNGINDNYTHLWGAKQVALDDPDFHGKLCRSLLNAIQRDFPQYEIPQEILWLLQYKY
ncbi:MAG: hypothetical protein J5554_11010 [Paludibacteraceae bacterium]|nr:hypothetical protein [Paludibacteraceae bacterium]